MFGRSYFGGHYFGGRYYGDGGAAAAPGASAAQIWAYVLPNGKSAGQNLAEINNLLTGSIDGVQGAVGVLKILLAVAAGESRVTKLGGGLAHVEFDGVNNHPLRVVAEMNKSERVTVALTPDT